MTRLPPLEPPFPPAVGEHLTRMMPEAAAPIALFRLFVRNLPMTEVVQVRGRYELGRQLTHSRREREIVIDCTCARAGCEYGWGRLPLEPASPRFAEVRPC